MKHSQTLRIIVAPTAVLLALFGIFGCVPLERQASGPSGGTSSGVPGRPGGTSSGVPGRPGGTAGLRLPPSGNLTMSAQVIAGGLGWTWDPGVLTLANGSAYEFRINGLNVAAVGVRRMTVVGYVFHLSKLQDFEGRYAKVSTEPEPGSGVSTIVMENDRGVRISIRGTDQGVSFNLSELGVSISNLKKKN